MFMTEAKTELLLSESKQSSLASLGTESLTPEFLLVALVTSAHKQQIYKNGKGGKTNVNMLDEYLSKLQLKGNRRPQRRIFVEINELQEEIEAHRCLNEQQRKVLLPLRQILYDRHGGGCPQCTAFQYILREDKRISDERLRLKALQKRSDALKAKVKQTIEVLEEGRGGSNSSLHHRYPLLPTDVSGSKVMTCQ
jgi:hypothetical protein